MEEAGRVPFGNLENAKAKSSGAQKSGATKAEEE